MSAEIDERITARVHAEVERWKAIHDQQVARRKTGTVVASITAFLLSLAAFGFGLNGLAARTVTTTAERAVQGEKEKFSIALDTMSDDIAERWRGVAELVEKQRKEAEASLDATKASMEQAERTAEVAASKAADAATAADNAANAAQGAVDNAVADALKKANSGLEALILKVIEGRVGLGSEAARKLNEEYDAATDGFVVARIKYSDNSNTHGGIQGLVNGEAHAYATFDRRGYGHGSFTMPVRKGQKWQVHYDGDKFTTIAVTWIPLR